MACIKKEKVASIMNLIGLSVAIAVCLTVFTFVKIYLSVDQFHKNADNIYLVQSNIERENETSTWAMSPIPLAPALKSTFPGIKNAVRFSWTSGKVKFEDKVFMESMWFADPDFLNVFSFDLKLGNSNDLHQRDAVILSSETAEKLFGDENPLGKEIQIILNKNNKRRLFVRGVAEEFNQAASFSFSMVTQFDNQWITSDEKIAKWDDFITGTFIEVEHASVINELNNGMDNIIKLQNSTTEDWKINSFHFENLKTMSKNRKLANNSFASGNSAAGVIVLLLIAGFIFTLACVNYTNISIASSAHRIKEIGMRKVLGGKRGQLIFQFLGENVILCFAALVVGVLFANNFLLPSFNEMFDGPNLNLELTNSVSSWVLLAGLLVVTSFVSGAYPAIYISSFQTAAIFRSSSRVKNRNIFMRILLTFQFILTFITISSSLILRSNTEYLTQLDWGYTKDGVYVLELEEAEQYAPMRDFLLKQSEVGEIAGSKGHIVNNGVNLNAFKYQGNSKEAYSVEVGLNYLETLNIRKKEGRFFDKSFSSDKNNSIVVNEKFVKMMNWQDAIGKSISFENKDYQIIGVTENFITQHFNREVQPMFMLLVGEENYKNIVIRYNSNEPQKLVSYIRQEWKSLFPSALFDGYFQSDVFLSKQNEDKNIGIIFSFIAFIALLISCMGLLGLSIQYLNQRMREIGVRKVLGATMPNLFTIINKGFFIQLIIATTIAAPASFYLMKMLLNNVYAVHMTLGYSQLIISGIILIVTALATISFVMYKVNSLSVTEVLREQ